MLFTYALKQRHDVQLHQLQLSQLAVVIPIVCHALLRNQRPCNVTATMNVLKMIFQSTKKLRSRM